MLQKSLYYAPIMLRAVTLCPKHASTILQLNAQLNYLIAFMNVLLEYLSGDCSVRVYRSFLSQLVVTSACCYNFLLALCSILHPTDYAKTYAGIMGTGLPQEHLIERL